MKRHIAKKSLGQNFLKSKKAIFKMREALNPLANDIVLEIGPGKGILTEEILPFLGKLIAVEKDKELVSFLEEKFTEEIMDKKLDIIEKDILDFDINTLLSNKEDYKVIGNIPYYITGAILKYLLTAKKQPEKIVLLLQKEVVDRIVSRDGKSSILSLSVNAYSSPKYIMKVSAKYFSPKPKVDSAIISLNNVSRKNFKNKKEEELFFTLIKIGFAHKRKKLFKNLQEIIKKEKLEKVFNKLNLDKNVRAEALDIDKWLLLIRFV